jgi:hypothetical protein
VGKTSVQHESKEANASEAKECTPCGKGERGVERRREPPTCSTTRDNAQLGLKAIIVVSKRGRDDAGDLQKATRPHMGLAPPGIVPISDAIGAGAVTAAHA